MWWQQSVVYSCLYLLNLLFIVIVSLVLHVVGDLVNQIAFLG